MELLEKVVKGLECHGHKGACGEDCPYHAPGERCSEPLCADALALIRQQQERIKELEVGNESKPVKTSTNSYGHKFYYCPNCGRWFEFRKPAYCDQCGQGVKWDA